MSENIPPPPSSDTGSASTSASEAYQKGKAPELTKDVEKSYNVSSILSFAAQEVGRVAPALNITLPLALPKLPKLLSALLPVLSSDAIVSDTDVNVPYNLSAEGRANLRRMALESRELMLGPRDVYASFTRPIFSSQTLPATDLPTPLTPKQRQRIKDQFADTLGASDFRSPYLILPANLEDRRLPTVVANIVVSAVDADDGPKYNVLGSDCLWDTGAHYTIISEDCLSPRMLKYLQEDPVNEPYVQQITDGPGPGGLATKVQVSAVINMSNHRIQLDTIAVVLPRHAIPNHRSGVIIGQLGAIDRLSYISTPRSIMAAEGRDPGEEYWGVFDVVKFIDVNLDLVHV